MSFFLIALLFGLGSPASAARASKPETPAVRALKQSQKERRAVFRRREKEERAAFERGLSGKSAEEAARLREDFRRAQKKARRKFNLELRRERQALESARPEAPDPAEPAP